MWAIHHGLGFFFLKMQDQWDGIIILKCRKSDIFTNNSLTISCSCSYGNTERKESFWRWPCRNWSEYLLWESSIALSVTQHAAIKGRQNDALWFPGLRNQWQIQSSDIAYAFIFWHLSFGCDYKYFEQLRFTWFTMYHNRRESLKL